MLVQPVYSHPLSIKEREEFMIGCAAGAAQEVFEQCRVQGPRVRGLVGEYDGIVNVVVIDLDGETRPYLLFTYGYDWV